MSRFMYSDRAYRAYRVFGFINCDGGLYRSIGNVIFQISI